MKSDVGDQMSAVCGRRSSRGFTLLELMTVMVIMFILMGMATMALRGVVRGAGISGAVSIARAVLTQARQQAIINQRQTAVVFQQGTTNSMVMVMRYGKTTVAQPGYLRTEEDLPWTAAELHNARVFDITMGTSGTLVTNGLDDVNSRRLFKSGQGQIWPSGREIGFPVGDERFLPDGMEFGEIPSPHPVVIFNADGSARADADISLQEKFVAGATDNAVQLHVVQMTGWVE